MYKPLRTTTTNPTRHRKIGFRAMTGTKAGMKLPTQGYNTNTEARMKLPTQAQPS